MNRIALKLYTELLQLEERAEAVPGKQYSRRAVAQAANKHRANLGDAGQRIQAWVPKDPQAPRQVPRDADAVWTLVQVWSELAGLPKPERNERWWRDLVEAAQPSRHERRPGGADLLGVPLAQALATDPQTYELHAAITVADSAAPDPVLTPYLRRPLDDRLDEAAAAVRAGANRIAVLVGGSSSGKTRACWELLRSLATDRPGWRVWHPLDGAQLVAGLAGGRVAPRTVLWLNELQRYLVREETPSWRDAAVALRNLLTSHKGGVLVLGTIWDEPDRWHGLVKPPAPGAPDRYGQARQLLEGAAIDVPATLDGPAQARAQELAQADPRWQVALVHGGEQPIAFLAGGLYLLERYRTGTPMGRAVLEAAADARRIGAPATLPAAFLELAAQDYLAEADHDRIPADQQGAGWVRHTIETDLRIGGRGVPGPLRPARTGPPGLQLSDYLEQHLRRQRATVQPRDSLWSAAAATVTEPSILANFRDAAVQRGRFRPAVQLCTRSLDLGDTTAVSVLSWLLENAGDHDRALRLLRERGDPGQHRVKRAIDRITDKLAAGKTGFDLNLWWIDTEEGTRENGEFLMWPPELDAFDRRIRAHQEAGDTAGAERVAIEAAGAGFLSPLFQLACDSQESGDTASAQRLWLQSIAAANAFRLLNLSGLREQAGEQTEADQIWRFGITVSGQPETSLGI